MSTLESVRSEVNRRGGGQYGGGPGLKTLALVVLLGVMAVLALGEIDLLPTFVADDFGSILVGSG